MKTCIITYSLCEGGSERNALNLASSFIKKGIETDIVSFYAMNDYEKEYGDRLKQLKIIFLSKRKRSTPIIRAFFSTMILIKLIRLLKKNNYNVIIAEIQFTPYYFASVSALLLKKKLVLVAANTFSKLLGSLPYYKEVLHKNFHKLCLKSAHKIVCVSKGVREDLLQYFAFGAKVKSKIEVIHCGLDLNYIREKARGSLPKATAAKLAGNAVVTVFGRLDNRKGHVYLIQSFKKLNERLRHVKLLILGDGAEYKNIFREVKNLELEDDVVFAGFQDNPYPYLKASSILVFPSLYEGFGNVIIESMACGLPVVSADCPHGPREILSLHLTVSAERLKQIKYADYGILTPPLDSGADGINAFYKAMLKILSDRKMYRFYKIASSKRAKQFSLNLTSTGFLNLLNEVVHSPI